jgi:pectate lyase-like protein
MVRGMMKRIAKAIGLAQVTLLIALFSTSQAQATTYYIDGSNSSASDSNPGTSAQPWKTINKANSTLAAGDTVFIKAGTYTTYISPSRSGTATARITYQNFGSDVVTIQNASYGIFLDGNSYITVQGINFFNLDQFMWLQNSSNHNTIAYCNFDQFRNVGWSGSKIYQSSSYNWVHHSRFTKYGFFDSSSEGTILDIGNEETQTDFSNYNLLEDSQLYWAGHHVLGVFGKFNVIRRNVMHNENWSSGHGSRVVYVAGYEANSGQNLFDSNIISYSGVPTESWGRPGLSIHTDHNIIRRNAFYHNNMPGINLYTNDSYYQGPQYNVIYNNSFLHNGYSTSSSADSWYHSAISMVNDGTMWTINGNEVKNNLYYLHSTANGFHNANQSDQIFAGNWNGETQGDPKYVSGNSTLGDPLSTASPDLHLQASSPAIDKGVALTTIKSSTGTGTSIVVVNAGYFTDGWGIITGDVIQLMGSSQRATVTSVNYSTNTLTLDTPLSWTANQGVALAYEGSAPDVGAYEVSSGNQPPSAPTNLRVF